MLAARPRRRPILIAAVLALLVGSSTCGGIALGGVHWLGPAAKAPPGPVAVPKPTGPTAASVASADACADPNPPRAALASLREPVELLADGGFEAGTLSLATRPGTTANPSSAAHAGKRGLTLRGDGQGRPGMPSISASIPVIPDRADETVLSAWVRTSGEARLGLVGAGGPRAADWTEWTPGASKWQRLELRVTHRSPEAVRFAIEARDATEMDVDDVSVSGSALAFAPCDGDCREVGGIRVPAAPKAPVLFALLLHVEDGLALSEGGEPWRRTTEILDSLAMIAQRHGGRLTIQTESSWLEGALAAGDGAVTRLEREGVVWSTHAHGPRCVDPQGVGHPGAECTAHPEWRVATDEDVTAYVRARQGLITRAGGHAPADHNGNFDVPDFRLLADAGVAELSAFKTPATQEGLPDLYVNPWRPSPGGPDAFVRHAPGGPLVYIPGVGTAITRDPATLPDRAARALSQVLRFADPSRVNTTYLVLNIGAYTGREGADVTTLDTALGRVVDPLVAGGWLKWATIPEMGEVYRTWEATCRR